MAKFKVGDRVKVINMDTVYDKWLIGHTGVIKGIDDDASNLHYHVALDKPDLKRMIWSVNFSKEELELHNGERINIRLKTKLTY